MLSVELGPARVHVFEIDTPNIENIRTRFISRIYRLIEIPIGTLNKQRKQDAVWIDCIFDFLNV